MTTIDERLDEVFDGYNGLIDHEYQGVAYDREDAKAAIRTLFLDLIAEAKPEYKDGAYYTKHPVLWKPVAPEDSDNNTADAGFNEGLERFENNLIQAINGGKK
jgi:hypothetical protein